MNKQKLETRLSIGIKGVIVLIVVLLLHSTSNVLNHLGILSDLLIVIGVYRAGQFLTNKELRQNSINKAKELIDTESIDKVISDIVNTINETKAPLRGDEATPSVVGEAEIKEEKDNSYIKKEEGDI